MTDVLSAIISADEISARKKEGSHPWNDNSLFKSTQLSRAVGMEPGSTTPLRIDVHESDSVLACTGFVTFVGQPVMKDNFLNFGYELRIGIDQ